MEADTHMLKIERPSSLYPSGSRCHWLRPLFLAFVLLAMLALTPASFGQTVSSLTLSPSSVTGNATSIGMVTLSAAAPVNGAVVTLTRGFNQNGFSPMASASFPASITIPEGAISGQFTVTTTAQYQSNIRSPGVPEAIVVASYGGSSQSATLLVYTVPYPTLNSVSVSPGTVIGGSSSTGTVTTSTVQGSAISVSLSSDNSAVIVPSSMSLATGTSTATFPVTTTSVTSAVTATITATYVTTTFVGTTTVVTTAMTVVLPTLTGISVSPSSVTGGASSTGTVMLDGPAPAGGVAVALSSSNAAAVVPASGFILIPAGATSSTFTVSTTSVTAATAATITATANGISQTATLTINSAVASGPSYLSNLSVNPTAVIGGIGTTGTVTLSSPAPVGGVTVFLTSNNGIAVVPASVFVPGGTVGQTFAVGSSSVFSATDVTLSAVSSDWVQATILTLLPTNQTFTVQNLVAATGNQCIILNWSDFSADNIRGYNIYRRQNAGARTLLTVMPQEAPVYADTNVSNSSAYQYQVSVVGIDGTEYSPSTWIDATASPYVPIFSWINPPSSVSDTIILRAALSGGLGGADCTLLVDGKEVSNGDEGDENDAAIQPTNAVVTVLDTSDLSNGTHVV